MIEAILKIAGMVVSLVGTIIKAIDLADRFKNQKSNRTRQG